MCFRVIVVAMKSRVDHEELSLNIVNKTKSSDSFKHMKYFCSPIVSRTHHVLSDLRMIDDIFLQ